MGYKTTSREEKDELEKQGFSLVGYRVSGSVDFPIEEFEFNFDKTDKIEEKVAIEMITGKEEKEEKKVDGRKLRWKK